VTVRRGTDPAELEPQPGHISVDPYLPQSLLLPDCAARVRHTGAGSVLGAVDQWLPMACVPLGPDQPLDASGCVALGVGREHDPATLVPDDVSPAVAAVLAEPGYRRGTGRV